MREIHDVVVIVVEIPFIDISSGELQLVVAEHQRATHYISYIRRLGGHPRRDGVFWIFDSIFASEVKYISLFSLARR